MERIVQNDERRHIHGQPSLGRSTVVKAASSPDSGNHITAGARRKNHSDGTTALAGSLQSHLYEARDRSPESPAITDASGTWTYEELVIESERFAQRYSELGVGSGDRVLIMASGIRATIAAVYGCNMVSAAAVPVDPSLPPYRRRMIVDDARPAAEVLPGRGETAVCNRLYVVDSTSTSELRPELLIYTSGTSSTRPKAVSCSSSAVRFVIEAISTRLQYGSSDRVFSTLPLFFDYGLYQAFLAAKAGSELILSNPRHPGLLTDINARSATVLPIVPTFVSAYSKLSSRRGDVKLSSVRLITSTGEHLSPSSIRQLRSIFPNAVVTAMYGATECKRITIADGDADLHYPGSVGQALPGTVVLVVDRAGHTVTTGGQGEIVVEGPHLMDGYWGDPARTSDTYRPGPTGRIRLHTGDMGRLDACGNLYVDGRRDDLFKMNGVRTTRREIEEAARKVGSVAEAVLVTADDPVLFVTGSAHDGGQVLRCMRDFLEPSKIPKNCYLLSALPITNNGKVDRSALLEYVRNMEVEHQSS